MKDFIPSDTYIKIKTIDAHTAGKPFCIITDGVPESEGKTILGKRNMPKSIWMTSAGSSTPETRGHV